jgi:hypothetical protein
MDPIEVVTLARFNLRVCQDSLAIARGAAPNCWGIRQAFSPYDIRAYEDRVVRAIDLLWEAQQNAA